MHSLGECSFVLGVTIYVTVYSGSCARMDIWVRNHETFEGAMAAQLTAYTTGMSVRFECTRLPVLAGRGAQLC